MIRGYLEKIIRDVLKNDVKRDVSFIVEHPRDERHGDFSTNVAMALAKKLKRSPLQIADKLIPLIQKADSKKYLAKIEAVKPGFINIRLAANFLQDVMGEILETAGKFGRTDLGRGKKIVLEYSQPNTNKPLHMGHFRNDVLGMAVHNLLETIGYDVVLTTIFNDRGRHICKSMLMYQMFGQGLTPERAHVKPDHFVGNLYARYDKEVTQDPTLEEKVSQMLVKWEQNDPEIRALWRKMNGWVYKGFEMTYKKEGTFFDTKVYESDIYRKGKEIVERHLKKGIFKKKDDGSIAVDLTKFGLDEKILLRSDGTSIYITQDLYLGEYRENEYHPERILYCVDIYQAYHFKVLFAIYELIGYKFASHCHHLAYGYLFLGREKMSSRKGNVVTTDDYLDEMRQRALKVMKTSKIRVPQSAEDETAEAIAWAAMKYGILRYELKKDIRFDPESTIQLTGDTGPYLQYTHARIQGIMRKSKRAISAKVAVNLDRPEEQALLRRLYRYPEVVETAALAYAPNILTEYLCDLAHAFNAFYNSVSVLQAETEAAKMSRLRLCAAVAQVLRNGLTVLGIKALERM